MTPECAPTAYRWRPPGTVLWIYDPDPEWLDEHKNEIEWEPVYAADAIERLGLDLALETRDSQSLQGQVNFQRQRAEAAEAKLAEALTFFPRMLELIERNEGDEITGAAREFLVRVG